MGSLNNLKLDDSVVIETESDRIGGGGFILESDAYDLVMDVVYTSKSKNGATAINFIFSKSDSNTWKHTVYVTNRKGEPFYIDKKTGEKKPLPGMSQVNAICLLSIGKELHALDTDEKVINLYNFDLEKDTPTKVDCITDLHGESITLGVLKQLGNKNVKGDDGVWAPSNETKESNEIGKVFRTKDHMTKAEIIAKSTTAEFYDKWVDKNTGVVVDKTVTVASGTGIAGAPKTASAPQTASLFAN